jgi:hypothetical protein
MKIDVDGERVNWLNKKLIQVPKEKSLKAPRKAYIEKLPISAAKKADLMSSVTSGIIPKE